MAPSALWLLSNAKRLKDVNAATIGSDDGNCIAMNRAQNSPQTFSLMQLNCNAKRFAICRITPPTVPTPKQPTKFPCMTESNDKRQKRSPDRIIQHEYGTTYFKFLFNDMRGSAPTTDPRNSAAMQQYEEFYNE